MSIRVKIILVVLPLVVLSLLAAGMGSAFSARNGLTAMAVEFMGFKAEELEGYARSQWDLLVNNQLQSRPDLVQVTRQSIAGHAVQMTRSPTELVLALEAPADGGAGPVKAFANRPLDLGGLAPGELAGLAALLDGRHRGWVEFRLDGQDRVGFSFWFEPFGWQVISSELSGVFYAPVNQIVLQTALVMLLAIVLAVGLLVVFAGILTSPLGAVVKAMDRIIDSGDLAERVEVRYQDEIGRLAHTFNTMMGQLDGAYRQIKQYALEAVIARRNEQKIRQIFQKYVPAEVINQIFENPERMLVGDTRKIAILFSDIRSFTTIAEAYRPDELVGLLNQYFSVLVETIIQHHGVVDKYIGDAVMAFFGAPASYGNDAADALRAGLGIVEALAEFNRRQQAAGRHQFLTGLGINFGEVTVGNIGTDKKMDYTVIGDNVNLASRLEGLTKEYHQPILVSQSLKDQAGAEFCYRLVDTVIVKGKTGGVRIHTAALAPGAGVEEAWALHDQACELFYRRQFREAAAGFRQVLDRLPGDWLAGMFAERCDRLAAQPPAADWDGTVQMLHK